MTILNEKKNAVKIAIEDFREHIKASIYSEDNPNGFLTAKPNKYLQYLQF